MAQGFISRLIGTDPPRRNGKDAVGAEPSEETKDVQTQFPLAPTSGIQFYGTDTGNLVYMSGGAPSDIDRVDRHTAFAAASYAYSAIKYRADKMSEAPLIVSEDETDEDGWAVLPDHPLAELLTEPSPDYDMGQFLWLTRAFRDMTGEALWVKNESLGGRLGMLTVFDGESFRVEPDTIDGVRRQFGRFRVTTRSGERTYTADEVVYFREPLCHAPLDTALAMLNLGKQATSTVKDVLRNALFPSVVIQADKEWNPGEEEFKRWKNSLDAYSRRDKKGEPLALVGGGSATVVSQDLTNLMPDEVLDRVEATVASVFGIHAVVLGWLAGLKNSPWSQMAEARRMVYEDTIEPMWRTDQRVLTRQLLRPDDPTPNRSIRFDTADVRALQLDRKMQADIADRTHDIGTLNERRALMGWDPLDGPEGDEIRERRAASSPFAPEAPEKGAAPPARKSVDEQALAWLRFDVQTKAGEPMWERVVLGQLEEQRAKARELFERHVRPGAKAAGDEPDPESLTTFALAFAEWLKADGNERLREAVLPLVQAGAVGAGRTIAGRVGFDFDLVADGVAKFAEDSAEFLAEVMGETTGRAVSDAVRKGAEEGDLIRDLAKRLEELPEFDRPRAMKVARTETTRVHNGAQQRSMSDYRAKTGRVVMKTWLSSRDARVRPEHDELDGTQLGIDGVFANGLKAPGEPNCRCTLTYQTAEAL